MKDGALHSPSFNSTPIWPVQQLLLPISLRNSLSYLRFHFEHRDDGGGGGFPDLTKWNIDAVGKVLAQRALADDTPRKGEKVEGKLQSVLQSVMRNGVWVKSAYVKKQTVFLLQTADVWTTSSSAELYRCGPHFLATRLGHQLFPVFKIEAVFTLQSSPSSAHGQLPASHCTWRTLPSGPPQQHAIDTAATCLIFFLFLSLIQSNWSLFLSLIQSNWSYRADFSLIRMEVNEPPIINVDEPPVVDVDDGDDEEVADNKGGGHKVSWVWRHFDQEVVKKGAKKVKCPYCGIMMCANMKKNGTSAMGTHLKHHCPQRNWGVVNEVAWMRFEDWCFVCILL
ncbi:hypothetical protein LXL04_025704 [Taraxacum kok-saghyz]